MRGRYNMAPGEIQCSSAATDWIRLCNGSLARVSQILLACVSNVPIKASNHSSFHQPSFCSHALYQLLAQGTARGERQTPFQRVGMMMGKWMSRLPAASVQTPLIWAALTLGIQGQIKGNGERWKRQTWYNDGQTWKTRESERVIGYWINRLCCATRMKG